MADDPRSSIAHLYRRAGFGASPSVLDAAVAAGFDATVDALLDQTSPDAGAAATPPPTSFVLIAPISATSGEEKKARNEVKRTQNVALARWWLDRMTAVERPLAEKMTLFWHGHFATGLEKVDEAMYMLAQNQIFRTAGLGRFEPLALAVAKDPAMLVWLDANDNKKGSPNENFARELMELFTIGIGSYSDGDVREAARAFTGTRVDRKSGTVSVNPRQLDATPKTILGEARNFGFDDTVTFLANRPETATFVSAKLWSRFAYPVGTTDPVVADIAGVFRQGGDIAAVMKALFRHPQFASTQARQGLVKQPIEWVVGAMRALGMRANEFDVLGPDPLGSLRDLNQVPFNPPSVGGWPQNGYWLSTATALSRLRYANALTNRANLGWLTGVAAPSRPDAIARQLSVDGWSAATRSGLLKATTPKAQLAIALASPEYVLA
jgi:uncharacterized protein (DUF1800 family)